MPRPQNEFPTILDLWNKLADLIDRGLGDHPVQVLVVPDATLQTIARTFGGRRKKPALMIEFPGPSAERMPVCVMSTEQYGGVETSPTTLQ